VDTGGAKKLVAGLVGSIVRNPDALTWMTQLKSKDAYTAEHSLNVCILTLTFARHLGMDEVTMKEIGLGGFMHDIGKLRVPLDILNKPGKLTEGEFELMKKHPTYGRDLLNRSGGVPSSTIDIAFSHHERAVGQGYPRGIQGEAISRFARIVAIVDVYDAISSDRIYHRGLSPQDSMKRLYEWRNGSLDGELVEQFIQALGVYPLGSVVELNSGELAIVLSTDPKSRLQPKVLIATNAEKQLALPHRIVDLTTETRRVGGGLAIRRVARPGDYDFDIGMIVKDHRRLLG
jgi:HD-GYP domain-containing protein (c-di-GMP phosphodiesterase class II)